MPKGTAFASMVMSFQAGLQCLQYGFRASKRPQQSCNSPMKHGAASMKHMASLDIRKMFSLRVVSNSLTKRTGGRCRSASCWVLHRLLADVLLCHTWRPKSGLNVGIAFPSGLYLGLASLLPRCHCLQGTGCSAQVFGINIGSVSTISII